ncbi:hypothetical protein FACS1894126_4310 [Alphaproteobacteria bacterium]|nr:hypothetical protein FACS1894126_4310 [Alphaproteobacteria bacterium]
MIVIAAVSGFGAAEGAKLENGNALNGVENDEDDNVANSGESSEADDDDEPNGLAKNDDDAGCAEEKAGDGDEVKTGDVGDGANFGKCSGGGSSFGANGGEYGDELDDDAEKRKTCGGGISCGANGGEYDDDDDISKTGDGGELNTGNVDDCTYS